MEHGKLSKVEPKEVFGYFEEICNIPHGSKNISKISDYLVDFAKEKNLNYIQDKYKNVIITKEASKGYENIPPIILQGHMDMVTVQTPEDSKNMETDGLEVDISGDYIYAKNTSLGGDDGIALAYSLALLASDTIFHPKLEVIFTVDEEVGMDGARGIDLSTLEGKRLINIDSEEEGYLLAGCAGGGTISGSISISREQKKGREIVISITDLKGGHSGVEIDKERGNALYLLSRILRNVKKEIKFSLITFEGGEKDNAIPCFAMTKIMLANENIDKFSEVIDRISEMIKKEFARKEPKLQITFQKEEEIETQVLVEKSLDSFLQFMLFMPNGVQAMSMDVKGLPETSLNMGILKFAEKEINFVVSVRSSLSSAKWELIEKVTELIKNANGKSELHGEYPAWEYKADSELRDRMCKLYKEMYGKEMEVLLIHAGLECGLLAEKIEDLDCVSIGPDMKDIHTTKEMLSISSTKRVWEFFVAFIESK